MYDTIEQQILQQQQKEPQQPKVEVEQVKPVAAEPTSVNDQITDSVTQEKPSPEVSEPVINTEDPVEVEETPWYEKTESAGTNTVDAKPAETTETPKVQVEDEDEDIQLLREFKKSGKTLKDFVSEFNLPDYSTIDDATIVELGLKQLEGFDGDDYAQAVEEFNGMSLFQRKKLIQEYRNTFLQQSESKLKQLTKKNAVQEDKYRETVERFESEVDTLAKEISGKEVYGLKVTDEMSTKIKNFLKKEISLNRADGSLDTELMADFALWRLYGKDIVRTNVTAAKNAGRKEMLMATTNPSSGKGPSNATGGFKATNADDAFNAYLTAKKL